jgi:hypothetical protein
MIYDLFNNKRIINELVLIQFYYFNVAHFYSTISNCGFGTNTLNSWICALELELFSKNISWCWIIFIASICNIHDFQNLERTEGRKKEECCNYCFKRGFNDLIVLYNETLNCICNFRH